MNAMTKHREAKGWSKAELARRADLNASTVGLIETRRLRPYDRQLAKLAHALDLRVEELSRDFGDSR